MTQESKVQEEIQQEVPATPAEEVKTDPVEQREAEQVSSTDAIPEVLTRTATIESIERSDSDSRIVNLSFSSEIPVQRDYGNEVLSHDKADVDLQRLNSAGPLLLDHRSDKQIGVVKKAWIGEDKKGRATVQFSKGALATEVWNDVQDGIRQNVSVGYVVTGRPKVQGDTYKWNWVPSHISVVSEPADITVGINRGLESSSPTLPEINKTTENKTNNQGGLRSMSEQKEQVTTTTNDGVVLERKRTSEIRAVANQFKDVSELQDFATKAIEDGTSVADFQKEAFRLLETKGAVTRAKSADIGLTEREAGSFSVSKMINHLLDPTNKKLAYEAGFEIEASRAAREKFGSTRGGNSFSLPYDVLKAKTIRSVNVSTAGSLIETEVLMSSYIDVLRNATKVIQLGATVLDGLVNTVQIPRTSAASTAYWLSTDTSNLTASSPSFDSITLSPHTLTGYTQVSRQALAQIPGIDAIITQDLARTSGVALDAACISGTGSSGQPKGILNLSSLPTVSLGTNGAAPTYASIVQLRGLVAKANALMGSLAYLGNPYVTETLATTLRDSANTASNYILGGVTGDMTKLAGYNYADTNNVPSNLTKGTGTNLSALIFANWNDAVIGSWGTQEIVVDQYTGAASNQVYVYCYGMYDFNVRHLGSFAAIVDMIAA